MDKNNKKGFTIIEVVLVLAIAGLIFLMVFIALPALHRSQRNTRRRQDMARILSAFNDYQSNNNGKMPSGKEQLSNLVNRYITSSSSYSTKDNVSVDTSNNASNAMKCTNSDQFCDPDGTSYWISETSAVPSTFNHGIYYYKGAKCGDTEGTVDSTNQGANNIAIRYYLEGGAIYCGDNQ